MLASVLIRFVCQITFGMSAAMLLTPPRLVTSGYFRVHMWVLLGLDTFAALLALTLRSSRHGSYVLMVTMVCAALLSYVASVCWLYESPLWGRRSMVILSVVGLFGCLVLAPLSANVAPWLQAASDVSAGMLLGTTLAAMFLGHWYLNTPSMELAPLRRLVLLMFVAAGIRALLCGVGAGMEISQLPTIAGSFWAILSLRWLSGLLGAVLLTVMTWYTLKIPNTQSATGILYVAVICVFLGELTSQFLSGGSGYPL